MRRHQGTSLGRKLRQGLEAQCAADSRDIGKRLEDLGIALRGTVVEENHRSDGRVTLGNNSRNDVSLGIGDVGSVRCCGLFWSAHHYR